MGLSQSKSETDEKVFYNETSVQFSQDIVNHLSDHLSSPETTPERQTTLDAHIRSRIQAELEHLRSEEEAVRQEIEHALERENLDREQSMAGRIPETEGEDLHGEVKSSPALLGDFEQVQRKVDRYQTRQNLDNFPTVKASGEAVVTCYRKHPSTPLDCWPEVHAFKASIVQLEEQYVNSLR